MPTPEEEHLAALGISGVIAVLLVIFILLFESFTG